MRTLSLCDIRLHPSTVDTDFEKSMVQDVLPDTSGVAYPAGALFIRSLYRRVGEDFPPGYRCLVHADQAGGSELFGLRPAIESLSAYTAEPRCHPLGGALPTDEEALGVARDRTAPGLVMITVHLSRRLITEQFEAELNAALRKEVTARTRVNNTLAAFWTRGDDAATGRIEYIVAALGQYMTEPRLRPDTLQQIYDALGVIVDSQSFHHVGTAAGGPAGND